jgi:hypothetical protein
VCPLDFPVLCDGDAVTAPSCAANAASCPSVVQCGGGFKLCQRALVPAAGTTATGTTTGANTSLTISEVVEDGKTYLNIRGKESQEDNPEHPLGLTEAQQQVAIGLLFKDTSNFEAEFKLYGVGEGGRNLFFTGASVQTEKGDDCTIITDEDDLPQDNALETRMRQVRDLAINEDASTMACALTEDESAEVKRLYAAADTEVAVAGGANLHHNARAKLGKRIRK